MTLFTGNDVRAVRKKHGLTRKALADYLEVSAVTVEKWEQSGDKCIRSKYQQKMAQLGGVGVAGIAVGFLAAPALLAPALIAGGAAGLGISLSDDGLKKAEHLLEGLKRLTPEERVTLFALSKKMNEKEG